MFGFNRRLKFLCFCALFSFNTAATRAEDKITAALLWVPAAGSDIKGELDALSQCQECRLTIALSVEQATPALRTQIKEEMRKGKLELALRAAGDPPLPLLFSPDSPEVRWRGKPQTGLWGSRLDILASVIFQARDRHQDYYGIPPSGFVPAGGGAIPQILEPMAAYEMRWLATGPSDNRPYEVVESSGVLLLPFHSVRGLDEAWSLLRQTAETAPLPAEGDGSALPEENEQPLPEPSVINGSAEVQSSATYSDKPKTAIFAVVDDSLSSPDAYRPLLTEFMSAQEAGREVEWMTVSSAAACALSTAPVSASDFPPPWTGDYTLWAGTLKQRAALNTLGEVRRAINVYANSHSGGHVSPKLVAGLTQLERGDKLLLFASTDTATASSIEEEFKQKVASLYRQSGLPVPVSLRGSLTVEEPEPGTEQPQVSTATVAVKAGESYLLLENPLKPLQIPAKYKALPGGADPQQLFNLQAVLVSWNEKTIKFTLRNRRLARQHRPLLRQLLLADIYMDINRRRNSGTGTFLPERKLSPNPDDAWEYAVAFSGQKAQVYKTSLAGIQAGRTYNTTQDSSGDITVEIPRSELRGNPKLWGYTALVMAADDAGTDNSSPAQLDGGDTVLDWLALDRLGSVLSSLHAPDRF